VNVSDDLARRIATRQPCTIIMTGQVRDLAREVLELRRWKAEAMECLNDWHDAYDQIVPRDFGLLGEVKPTIMVRYVASRIGLTP
jgi:hypothetical protein